MHLTYSFFFLLVYMMGISTDPSDMAFSLSFTELENLEKETSAKQIKSWKNESILLPIMIKKDGGDPETVNLTFSSNPSFSIRIAKLEYVLADLSAGACGTKKVNGKFEEAYFPDRVNYLSDLKLELNHEVNYLLVKIFVFQDTRQGKYPINVKIENSHGSKEIRAEITVIDKILPAIQELDFELNFWQFPRSVYRFHQITPWGKEHMDLLERQFVHLSNINQKSITTSIFWDLYNSRPGDKDALMVKCIKKEDGSWEYDYTNFEKYVELGILCGIDQQIDVHNLFPWNQTYYYIDQKTGQIGKFTAGVTTQEYRNFWTPFLKDFSGFLDKKGWKEKVMFFIDERNKDQSIALAGFIKSIDPDFKVGYAGRFHADLSEVIDDYSLPSNISMDKEELDKRKGANKTTTFYTACWEKQPNMLMMNNYLDFYFLLMLSKARGYDGFLRWAFNSWGGNIMTDARYSDVPSGDAHFFYPYDQPSIRYELIQDSLEEVHKVSVLPSKGKVADLLKEYNKQSLLGNQKERSKLVNSMMNLVNQ